MQILKSFALITITLCNGSNAIENQIFSSNGEYEIDSNKHSNAATPIQAYGSSVRRDTSTLNLVQPDYIRIASLFEKENGRFCLQPRIKANPPVRIVTKPCSDSEEQLFYVDEYGFLRWSSNKNMCLMRSKAKKSKVLLADYCDKGKDHDKLLYTSFDGAIIIGRKSTNLWAATFKGKNPRRNVVIKMEKRDYKSPRQLWKIEHVSATSLTPTGKLATLAPSAAPTVHTPSAEPTSTPTAEPSIVPTSNAPSAEPTSTPTAEPSIAPTSSITTIP